MPTSNETPTPRGARAGKQKPEADRQGSEVNGQAANEPTVKGTAEYDSSSIPTPRDVAATPSEIADELTAAAPESPSAAYPATTTHTGAGEAAPGAHAASGPATTSRENAPTPRENAPTPRENAPTPRENAPTSRASAPAAPTSRENPTSTSTPRESAPAAASGAPVPAHHLSQDQTIVREESLALDGTAQRLTQSVVQIDGVAALAPGLRDLVASATARVLHRTGGDPMGIDLTRAGGSLKVRIDAHFDDSRSVAEIADQVCSVVRRELDEPVDIDLRVLSRNGGPAV